MDEQKVRDIVNDILSGGQYNVAKTPAHTHNHIDSLPVNYADIVDAPTTGTFVTSVTAGAGISVSPTTGAPVVTNTGVTQLNSGAGFTAQFGPTGSITGQTSPLKSNWNSHLLNATDVQTIAHGLGAFPRFIMINASFVSGTALMGVSHGTYDGTITACTNSTIFVSSGIGTGGTGTSIIFFSIPGATAQANLSSWDATNFSLSWSNTGGGFGATCYFTWTTFP